MLTASSGYFYMVKPYCGKDTNIEKSSNGSGYDIIISLIDRSNPPKGTYLYFDNHFIYLQLLEDLHKRRHWCHSHYSRQQIGRLSSKNFTDKESPRGDISFTSNASRNLNVVLWNDNQNVATNCFNIDPFSNTAR